MKNLLRNIIGLALVGFCLACQSNTYKISGTAKELQDGDIVYFNSLSSVEPFDSAVVKHGKFELSGTASDTLTFGIAYAKKNEGMAKPLFYEAGNISLTLSSDPMESKAYGTFCNNKLQEMTDTTNRIVMRIEQIAEYIHENNLTAEEHAAEVEKAGKFEKDLNKIVIDYANENIGNDFGYFLVTYYPSDVFTPQAHLALLKKLPDDKRNRPEVAKLEKQIKSMMKLEVGNTIETFSINDINGKKVDILTEAANHKMTILDFWASWCGPCRQEMPNLVSIYSANKDKGLGIIGISLDNDADSWKQAVKDLGMKWTQVSDLKGWHSDAAVRFGVNSIPMTYIIDSKGKIIAKGLRGEELKTFVEQGL